MKVILLSTESLQELEAEAIQVTTISGNRTILQGHAPCIEQLMQGAQLLIHLTGGATKSLQIPEGFIRVSRTELLVLIA